MLPTTRSALLSQFLRHMYHSLSLLKALHSVSAANSTPALSVHEEQNIFSVVVLETGSLVAQASHKLAG